MKLSALEITLLAAARAERPGEHVPYAFEKRILARLADVQPLDLATLWGRALWRGALACVAVTMIVSAAWALQQHQTTTALSTDFSQDFESAVLVMADQPHDSW